MKILLTFLLKGLVLDESFELLPSELYRFGSEFMKEKTPMRLFYDSSNKHYEAILPPKEPEETSSDLTPVMTNVTIETTMKSSDIEIKYRKIQRKVKSIEATMSDAINAVLTDGIEEINQISTKLIAVKNYLTKTLEELQTMNSLLLDISKGTMKVKKLILWDAH